MAAPCIRFSSAPINALFRSYSYTRQTRLLLCARTHNIATSNDSVEKDPLPLFMSKDIQRILKNITGLDVEKVAHRLPSKLKKPSYQLLTNEEVDQEKERASKYAKRRLQMPPFMSVRKPIDKTLAEDTELTGYDDTKYIFTDISFGLSNRERLIVVRDPDGKLRTAEWAVRDRINQIYNAVPGQSYFPPKMFEEEHLERVLKDGKFIYILDKLCVQYEPDSPDYIRVTHRTYEYLNQTKNFEVLRSTRHFGPLAFYLAWYKQIDYLLIDMIKRHLIDDAIFLIHLYAIIHPDSETAKEVAGTEQNINRVKVYCRSDGEHRGELELTIQAYTESLKSKSKDENT